MITLLDYGAGNVRSVINAIERAGESVKIVTSGDDILSAQKLVFPGVGAFGSMMESLEQKKLVEPLKAYLEQNRPFLGICLGLHVLFNGSDEALDKPGLGFLAGQVKRFDTMLSIPHIGWNGISCHQSSVLWHGLSGQEKFYFVHSYHPDPIRESDILCTSDYGNCFASGIQKGNVIAVQFHPEKSGQVGLRVLENFIKMDKQSAVPIQTPQVTRLAKRIIACLDVRTNDQGDLVVTKGDQYDVREKGNVRNLGKPVSLAQRYYEAGADEITFLNITGFRDFPLEDMPMLDVLRQTSQNVYVPLTIGGGIRDYTDANGRFYSALDVASAYFRSGADKISIGSDAVHIVSRYVINRKKARNNAIETIAKVYGSQAVVISIDPRRVYISDPERIPFKAIPTKYPGPNGEKYCWYQCTVKGGRERTNIDVITLALVCEKLGAGEILLNCIDRDGTNSGFDIELINAVRSVVSIPVIASSGAGCEAHFLEVFTQTEAEAALAAGIFHRNEVLIHDVKKYLAPHYVEIRQA